MNYNKQQPSSQLQKKIATNQGYFNTGNILQKKTQFQPQPQPQTVVIKPQNVLPASTQPMDLNSFGQRGNQQYQDQTLGRQQLPIRQQNNRSLPPQPPPPPPSRTVLMNNKQSNPIHQNDDDLSSHQENEIKQVVLTAIGEGFRNPKSITKPNKNTGSGALTNFLASKLAPRHKSKGKGFDWDGAWNKIKGVTSSIGNLAWDNADALINAGLELSRFKKKPTTGTGVQLKNSSNNFPSEHMVKVNKKTGNGNGNGNGKVSAKGKGGFFKFSEVEETDVLYQKYRAAISFKRKDRQKGYVTEWFLRFSIGLEDSSGVATFKGMENVIVDYVTINPMSMNHGKQLLEGLQQTNRIWYGKMKPSREGSSQEETELINKWIEQTIRNNKFVGFTMEYYKGQKIFAFIRDGSNECYLAHVEDKQKFVGFTRFGYQFIQLFSGELLVISMDGKEVCVINPTQEYYDPTRQDFKQCEGGLGLGCYTASIEIKPLEEVVQNVDDDQEKLDIYGANELDQKVKYDSDLHSDISNCIVHCKLTNELSLVCEEFCTYMVKDKIIDKVDVLLADNNDRNKLTWQLIHQIYTDKFQQKIENFLNDNHYYANPDNHSIQLQRCIDMINKFKVKEEEIDQDLKWNESEKNMLSRHNKCEFIVLLLKLVEEIDSQTDSKIIDVQERAIDLDDRYKEFQLIIYQYLI